VHHTISFQGDGGVFHESLHDATIADLEWCFNVAFWDVLASAWMLSQVLKQKRLYENQREQLYNQQFNMEQTSFALESIKDTAQTVQAMKAAGAELKQAFKKQDLNIDSIEKLQDEMADLMVRVASTASDDCNSMTRVHS
jgi:uncharacterized protein HemX